MFVHDRDEIHAEEEFDEETLLAQFMEPNFNRRAPEKIEAVCRYLDQILDWVISWDPAGGRARAPIMNKHALWKYDFKRWCDVENEGKFYCSRSLFFYVWGKYYDHVYLTDKHRYRQCKLCKSCNVAMKKAYVANDLNMKKAVFLLKSVHLEHIRNLRRNVKSFEKIAKSNPDFLLLFGDRADSHNFAMPSWGRGTYFVCAIYQKSLVDH